ncbi:disease resistance protein RUN1-like [Eucalyptus grandis]|uniref:disease resistance protein RUN1-like n=1 Tax=Eucalyptus grandis TaxID=71139 RepID=UPI00192E90BD|nr:disease resistance protein RUN1-like [Eucalyptus grandis]
MAPILLSGLALYFLNKKKNSMRRNARDADTGASGSLTTLTETNSGASSSSTALTKTDNSASTSSTVTTGNHYDVFLSFRGPDTREGFTDHLYNGLVDAGIRTFRDDDELRQGEKIGPDLLAAIENSKILIPILSVNYGSSKWCLDELVRIMEFKNNFMDHLVLPIFYKVEPAHVRHQIGSFGDAFHTRERRFDQTILDKWKQALKEVSDLKGWEAKGYEGELVKKVVQKVLSELKKEFELVLPENLVGINSHVEKVMDFVDKKFNATLFVGIHGMGGIGKTTLAKTIYNKLFHQFDYHSFIADIRESCKRNGLEYLQNQLIYDILKQKNQVYNKDVGIKFISSKFEGKRVLILLDDVDDDDQLKALAGNHNWFSSGSRIIITTRNKTILDNVGVDYSYEQKEMDMNQSLILFCRHAFRRDSPPGEFEQDTHKVVSTTGGLPLSLEVLGSFLCGKKPTFWHDTINKLQKVPHKKVREKLRISYEALEHGQKQIFLDIACFFIGTDGRIASYMWDACGFFPEEGIEILRFMSLIKVGDDQELRMHDQLRDLGREIVREENQQEPQYRSRLWDSQEVLKVLKGNKVTVSLLLLLSPCGTVKMMLVFYLLFTLVNKDLLILSPF